jgi:regulator of cell morphogenesis and NO signaling
MNTIQLIKLKNAGNETYFTSNISNEANDNKNKISSEHTVAEFNKCDTDFLIDHIIKTHHTFAKTNSIIIYNLTQKAVYCHSDNHPELKKFCEVAFFFFQHLLNQLLKEELYLFPIIRQAANNDAALQALKENIKLQRSEHKRSLEYLEVFRQLTNNYKIPADSSYSYKSLLEKMKEFEDDLNVHFHLEDDVLFKMYQT